MRDVAVLEWLGGDQRRTIATSMPDVSIERAKVVALARRASPVRLLGNELEALRQAVELASSWRFPR